MSEIIRALAHIAHVEIFTPRLDESTRFFHEIMGIHIQKNSKRRVMIFRRSKTPQAGFERSYIHSERRMHEMEAVVEMLEEKKLPALMSTAAKKNLIYILHSRKK